MGLEKYSIIFLGAPGSGKSSLVEKLAEKHSYEKIETGKLLREEAKSESRLGNNIKETVESGNFVPTEIIQEIIKNIIKKSPKNTFLFDGFPRYKDQINPFFQLCEDEGLTVTAIVILEIKKRAVIERVKNRLVCPNCGAVYNNRSQKPAEDNKCRNCGSGLEKREEDNEETLNKRFKDYQETTVPVINYLKSNFPDKTIILNGEDDINKLADKTDAFISSSVLKSIF